jgi:hypothetical protein
MSNRNEARKYAQHLLEAMEEPVFDIDGVATRARPSLVMISDDEPAGVRLSGFAMDGYVFTAGYGPGKPNVISPDSARQWASPDIKVHHSDETVEGQPRFSILLYGKSQEDLLPSLQAKLENPTFLERVLLVWFRQAQVFEAVGGTVEGVANDGTLYVRFDQEDLKGFGGAPVLDREGRVYGMLHSLRPPERGVPEFHACVPVGHLLKETFRAGIPIPIKPLKRFKPRKKKTAKKKSQNSKNRLVKKKKLNPSRIRKKK